MVAFGQQRPANQQQSRASSHSSARLQGAGLNVSKSTPALPCLAYYNLRDVRGNKKTLGMERVEMKMQKSNVVLETMKERARRMHLQESQAYWEQRDEDERGVQEAHRKAVKKAREKAFEQRQAEQKAAAYKSERDNAIQWRKDEEAKRKWAKDLEDAKIAERQEEERKHAEKMEKERIQRIPRPCDNCNGSGVCPGCGGLGLHQQTYLSSKVDAESRLQFGHGPQGCETCLGYKHGIRGKLMEGNGKCVVCSGIGKFCTGHCAKKNMNSWEEEADAGTGVCERCGGTEVKDPIPKFLPLVPTTTKGAWL